jgi:hypothetical protein
MDNTQIAQICLNSKVIKKNFKGVYAIDEIPRRLKPPTAIIINTDKKNSVGEHWVASYSTKDTIFFFDSLGGNIHRSTYLFDHLYDSTRSVVVNSCRYQQTKSTVCGVYVILFLYYMNKGYTYSYFLNLFRENDLQNNDRIVCELFKSKLEQNCSFYKLKK